MHGVPTFSQLAQAGSRWSQRCFLIRQRLQVLKLLKLTSTDLVNCEGETGKCVDFAARPSEVVGEEGLNSSPRLRLDGLDMVYSGPGLFMVSSATRGCWLPTLAVL